MNSTVNDLSEANTLSIENEKEDRIVKSAHLYISR
jgi:hypothetical protein